MKILLALMVLSHAFAFAADFDKEEFRMLVRENLPKFSQCYENSPAYKSGQQGKMVVQINLNDQGRATDVKAVTAKSSFHDAAVEKCVADKIKSMNFPKPPAGEEVEINYPFVFVMKKETPATAKAGEPAPTAAVTTDKK